MEGNQSYQKSSPMAAPGKLPPKLMCLRVPQEKVTVKASPGLLTASTGVLGSPLNITPSAAAQPLMNATSGNSRVTVSPACGSGSIKVASLLPSATLAWPTSCSSSSVIRMSAPGGSKSSSSTMSRIAVPSSGVSQWLTVAVSSGVTPITITGGGLTPRAAVPATTSKPEPSIGTRRILPAPAPGVIRVSAPSRIAPTTLTIQQGSKNCLKPLITSNTLQKTAVVVSNAIGPSVIPLQRPPLQNGVILSHGKITAVLPGKNLLAGSSSNDGPLKTIATVVPAPSPASGAPVRLASPPLRKKEAVLVDLTEDKNSDDGSPGEKCGITVRRSSFEDVPTSPGVALGGAAGRVVSVTCGLPNTPIILHTPKLPLNLTSIQGSSSSAPSARPVITVPRLRLTSHSSLSSLASVNKKPSSGTITVSAASATSKISVQPLPEIRSLPPINYKLACPSTDAPSVGMTPTTSSSAVCPAVMPSSTSSSCVATSTATSNAGTKLVSSNSPVILSSSATASLSVRTADTPDCSSVSISSVATGQISPDSSVQSCSSPELASPGPGGNASRLDKDNTNCEGSRKGTDVVALKSSSHDAAGHNTSAGEGAQEDDAQPAASVSSRADIIRVPDIKSVTLSCFNKDLATDMPGLVEATVSHQGEEEVEEGEDSESDIECLTDEKEPRPASPEESTVMEGPGTCVSLLCRPEGRRGSCGEPCVSPTSDGTRKIEEKAFIRDENGSPECSLEVTVKVDEKTENDDCDVVMLSKEESTNSDDSGPSGLPSSDATQAGGPAGEEDEDSLHCDEEIHDMLSNVDEDSPKKLEDLKFAEILSLERKSQVAELKGTKLKFKLNEFNVLEIDGQTHSDSVKMLCGSSNGSFRFGSTVLNLERALKSKQNSPSLNTSSQGSSFNQDLKSTQTATPTATDADLPNNVACKGEAQLEIKAEENNEEVPPCPEEVTILEESGADSCTITAEVVAADQERASQREPENSRVCVCSVCGGYGLESEFMRGGRYCSPGCCRTDNQLEPDPDDGERKTRRIEMSEDCKENKENRLSNRDKDSDFSHQSKAVNPRCPWLDQRSQFSWVKYIEYCQKVDGHGKAAPLKLWSEPFPSSKNLFQPGMKLEGIDPQHQSLFCVLTVVDVMGHRVKLHFDGYSDLHDFWTYADSPNLFPVGWCERNGRELCPPRGTLRFSWKSYLEHCGGTPAPRQAFTNKSCRQTSKAAIVQPGMKLEAEDRKNGWVCVATAQDVLDKRILVHFDGWGSTYDVWTDLNSPFIHPVGWCAENDVQLYAPQDYLNPESFNWPEYLRETNTSAVPAKALKPRQPKDFKKDMKLEVVDKRNPMLIRVATIAEVYNYQIKIHFDGWDDMYDYWVDDDSEDIHPPSWCNKTGHPLQPPMTDEAADGNGCGVLGCKGYGHVKGPIYTTHHTSFGCPYSVQNYNKDIDVLIPDRVLAKPEKKSRKFSHKSLLLDLGSGEMDDEDSLKKRVRKRRRFFDEISAPENKAKITKPFPDSADVANPAESNLETLNNKEEEQSADVEVHQSVFCGGFLLTSQRPPLSNWRHVKHLFAPLKDVDRDTVLEWTSEEVGAALEQLPGCEGVAECFTAQKVDGEALLLITQNDLVQQLHLRLGHALKIMAFVDSIRFKEPR